jgi:hypothetical protein
MEPQQATDPDDDRPRASERLRRRLPISYVLPLAAADGEDLVELAAYLRWLGDVVDDVIVVDGSSRRAVERHRAQFGERVAVVEPRLRTPMGKVGNVITGIDAAAHEHVVIADDDVRYERDQLRRVDALLRAATVVRPQNHFAPLPWHARIDTARTLLARITGGDWPGTLGVRRSAVRAVGGYAGDVLFENLELVRTLVAAGGTELVALDVIVRRVPPTTAHFRGQQVRQAYDELARPGRLLLSLLVAPTVARIVARRRWSVLASVAAAASVAAEAGRRRAGGRACFPASSTLVAGPWLLWRSLCSWAAVGAYFRGGVRYRDVRLRRAATPATALRRRVGARSPAAGSG